MDTFSTSLPTFKISSIPTTTTNREFHQFTTKTPHANANAIPSQPKPPHFSNSTSKPNIVVVRQKTKTTFSHDNSFSSSNTRRPSFHDRPATGYAAAIVDVAQKTNTLHSVQTDVHRLLRILKFQSDGGGVVDPSAVVEQGNFQRHVVALVKMLMKKKNNLGIVEQVLEEFERIYEELCGTQVVLVSSKRDIGGIAKKLNGAVRMRVRVRNLVQHNFHSFAM